MAIDALLSTIILVSFLVTIIIAIGSYIAYKLRDARRPGFDSRPHVDDAPFFQRVRPEDLASSDPDEQPWK